MFPQPEQIQILIPIAIIVTLFSGIFRPIYGTAGYFITMFGKLGDMYPELGAIRIELIIALLVFLPRIFNAQLVNLIVAKGSKINGLTWMLFATAMVSVGVSLNAKEAWTGGGYFVIQVFLLYLMIVSSVKNISDLKIMVITFIAMSFWTAYEPVFNYVSGKSINYDYGTVSYGRFGIATAHVALANHLVQALPLAYFMFMYFRTRKIHYLIFLLFLVTIGFGIIVTKSRGGFVGLLTVILSIAWLSRNRVKSILFVIILSIGLLALGGSAYTEHMATIGGGIHQSKSTNDRYLGLVHGLGMMVKRPILGVGVGCYSWARGYYFGYTFYAHNLYGELFGELGLASSIWFLWVFTMFRSCKQLKVILKNTEDYRFIKAILTGIQISLFARLVIGNFSHSSFIWFWFLMAGLIVGVERIYFIRKEEEDSIKVQLPKDKEMMIS